MKKFDDPIENFTKDGWLGMVVWLESPKVTWVIFVVTCITITASIFIFA